MARGNRRARRHGLAALLLAGSVAACGAKPEPGLSLVPPLVGTPTVDMLTATTRRPVSDSGLRFGGERAATASYAAVTVSIPPNRPVGDVAWPRGGRPDPAQSFAAVAYEDIDGERVRAALRERVRVTGHRHLLVFVHGYNTRFDEAVFRLAQIVHDSGAPVTPVLFSWPSYGSLTRYPYDRESAAFSRDALERTLAAAAAEPSVSQVTVLAHSMGGWLTLESLRQMVIRRGEVPAKITDVMLASPDVDVDVANSLARTIVAARRKPKLVLFVSSDDRALGLSRLVWRSTDRLGAIDPNREPYRTRLAEAGVEVIDLTDVRSSDGLNHAKFAASPLVVRSIGARLASGQALAGNTSSGEAAGLAAQGVLGAVGAVVTAPLTAVAGAAR